MKVFGHYWEVFHEKTGHVVNSGFEKGDDMSTGQSPDKNVKGYIYRVIPLYVPADVDAQQAKRVPLSDDDIDEIALDFCLPQSTRSFARAIEAHHGITPTVDEPEDLYALALKADNWGQP